jgi:outer membrane protein OmpA-like peptidoglycan-associated protein
MSYFCYEPKNTGIAVKFLHIIPCWLAIFAFQGLGSLLVAQVPERIHYPHLINLGPVVNTAKDESSPVISPDGNMLVYSSSGHMGSMGGKDIYLSYRQEDGTWAYTVNAGAPLNNADHNVPLAITPDGNNLLVYIHTDRDSLPAMGLSRATANGWTAPKRLKFVAFQNPTYSSMSAWLHNDAKTLLISMIGPESLGSEDLYVSFYIDSLKAFSTPKHLGAVVNSAGTEYSPYLASDGLTLYYSSNGLPGSLGGDDVYASQRLDDSWTNWSPPHNLGPEVNTPGDDYHFKFPASASYALMVSTACGDTCYGGLDIYRVHIPQAAKPQPVVLVQGRVLDQGKSLPMGAEVSYVMLPDGEVIGTAVADAKGQYQIILPAGRNYAVMANVPGFLAETENLDLSAVAEYSEMDRDLQLAPLKSGQTIQLNNIFFAVNDDLLREASRFELDRLITLLRTNPRLKVELSGHTDNIGEPAYNDMLSQRRADAVRSYILEHLPDLDPNRIQAKGFGSRKPIADNTTNQGRQKNRRVDFQILEI